MGIEGRDYMRERPVFAPGVGGIRTTWWLIGINVGVWLVYTASYGRGGPGRGLGAFFDNLVLHPDEVVRQGRVWQLFTALWLHEPGSLGHILFNMIFLYLFAAETERLIGGRGLLRLYLIAGLVSTGAVVLQYLLSPRPMVALGASGAIYGTGVFLALRMPRLPVVFFFLEIPLWFLVGVVLVGGELLQLVLFSRGSEATVAHLAGAGYGWVHHRLLSSGVPSGWGRRRRARSPERPPEPDRGEETRIRARVDALLGKIQQEGMASLTAEEKDFLQDASRRYGSR